jgi:glycosyltransferase involved in cell wall biosynthesis
VSAPIARLPITVVVPTRNEARNLPACLQRLDAFEAVLVIDSGSTDETCAIAEAAGARVVTFTWNGRYPKKRNWCLLNVQFSTPWVLFLDADEKLTPAFIDELRSVLGKNDHVGYWLSYSNHFLGGRLRFGIPQRKLALFRVGAGLYERIDEDRWSSLDMEVHEHPELQGSVGLIRAQIDHDDDRGLHAFISRHNEYSSWEAMRYRRVMQTPEVFSRLTRRQIVKYKNLKRRYFPFLYFLINYFGFLGLIDGWRGFVYSIFKLFYFMQVREKIIELERAEDRASNP